MKKLDLLIAGMGGQGIILASDIIAEVALASGYDIKKTDTRGMAQRGGSVVSQVRIAEQVFSPLIRSGEADMLLAFEKLEAARWAYYLGGWGTVIANNLALPPLTVTLGYETYPSDAEITRLVKRQKNHFYLVNGTERVKELGNIRTLNIFMLGCASLLLPFSIDTWEEVIAQRLPAKIRQINLSAFKQGRKEMPAIHLREG
ncbi:MAG: indolepyruvate oxidoreductase subunit beta [Dehalococcoidia bacterium]|nr:MAG: indolepyruvate oxidoreductase subunit beta [Dehalococcoidia bacterium]